MAALTKVEHWLLCRLLKKMISGGNGQQMSLFGTLYALDEQVHYEDNEATRLHWYQKWFELGFSPTHKMGQRTPRLGSKVSHWRKGRGWLKGEVLGIVVSYDGDRRTTIKSSTQIDVVD
jgi:hypothetical protein